MSLLVEATKTIINTDEVARGSLIWAKHSSWDEGVSGMVSDATEQRILVRFLPSIQNVMNHYVITADELVGGEWRVRYSGDGMETVSTYGIEEESAGEDTESDTSEES